VDAVAAVSAPSRWYIRDTPVMRRLHPMAETAAGRALARAVFKVRLDAGWRTVPPSPLELVHRIAPTPVLVVHGDRDNYFPIEHPLALAAAAGEGCDLWLEPGFGHAENAVSPALLHRVADWLTAASHLAEPRPAGSGTIGG
jgi:pimeloyl-ACP methyl ester carboxylesterase